MTTTVDPVDKTVYTFMNHEYDLKITMGHAVKTLKPDFGIDLQDILREDVIDDLLQRMFLNDSLALDLWWYHVKQHLGADSYDTAIDNLTPQSLEQFKDIWWNAVILFIRPLRGEILRQILKEAPKLIKKNMQNRLLETQSESGS